MEDKIKVQAKNLTKRFGDLLVLDDISFDVKEGEFLCIVGPTGCGKTTFLNCLTKLFDITAGEILVDGNPIDCKKNNISYILQETSTMEWLTVEQNVRFGLDIKKVDKKLADERVAEMLEIVGLTKFKDYYPRQLSVSMIQRVVIARAFATYPELLLMDEPYGQLDIDLRFKLEDELVALWKKTGTTIIFITHNVEEAVYLGERIMVLTNKPTKVKHILPCELERPRDVTTKDFVDIRNEVTDLIKWW
ncbi:ABC transporter ATP-binding protein [Bengtsoniella intestinalis]|uniref:ABC transporter ATP-binding protein n=1 Tax=Bengtsoniella intestinalis TaxID=3073143 RepID=UPI00391EE758